MMNGRLSPIRQLKIRVNTSYTLVGAHSVEHVNLDSPAIKVMTDLRKVEVLTTKEDVQIDAAQKLMIDYGVRSLIVVDESKKVLGIITATDILGDKPIKLIHEHELLHKDILVRDVMTPAAKIEVISLIDVSEAVVANVVEMLRISGRHHALVVDQDNNGHPVICGIFSATQITRQMHN